MATKFEGTGVAIVTPFTANDQIDHLGVSKLLGHLEPSVNYYVVCGTTGESPTLTHKEKEELLNLVLEINNGKKPVVFGIGGNNTRAICHELRELKVEVDGILSVSPAYSRPSQRGIIAHFNAVADHSQAPIILYNVPARTGSNMLAETTLELAEHPNIIGIKEASGDLQQCRDIATNKPDGFELISGEDMLTPEILKLGGCGVISVLANAFPVQFQQLLTQKDVASFSKLATINPLMYKEANPVGIKEVLRQMGICENHVRLPLLAASSSLSEEIGNAISQLN